jgi:hypothetical protein
MAPLIRSNWVEVRRSRPVPSADGRRGGDPRRGGRATISPQTHLPLRDAGEEVS